MFGTALSKDALTSQSSFDSRWNITSIASAARLEADATASTSYRRADLPSAAPIWRGRVEVDWWRWRWQTILRHPAHSLSRGERNYVRQVRVYNIIIHISTDFIWILRKSKILINKCTMLMRIVKNIMVKLNSNCLNNRGLKRDVPCMFAGMHKFTSNFKRAPFSFGLRKV